MDMVDLNLVDMEIVDIDIVDMNMVDMDMVDMVDMDMVDRYSKYCFIWYSNRAIEIAIDWCFFVSLVTGVPEPS